MDFIRQFLRRDRDYFANHQHDIQTQNFQTLRLANLFFLSTLICYGIVTFFLENSIILRVLHGAYLIAALTLCAVMYVKEADLRHDEGKANLCRYLFELMVLSFFLLEAVFPYPNKPSIFLPLPILMLVVIFSIPVKRALALIVGYVGLFAIFVFLFKVPVGRRFDIYVASATLISAVMGYVIVIRLRHETSTTIGLLHYLSTMDALTGLCNKQTFESLCQAYMADPTKKRGHAMLFFDVDDFKHINDVFGHQVGDNVLRGVGAIMRDSFYEKDYLCRFGGDEFVVFMVDVQSEADVSRTVRAFADRVRALGRSLRMDNLSCSVGVAMKPDVPETYQELLVRADAALYVNKRSAGKMTRDAREMLDGHDVPAEPVETPAEAEQGMVRRVLIVDDNRMNRILLHQILTVRYDVQEAQNGQEAMDMLCADPTGISAVLLDILMPVMDGYEVLQAMRSDVRLRGIPVIVTTGQTDAEAEIKSLSLGADDVVVKPYRAAIIMQRLQNIIHLRELAARGESHS